MHFGMTKHRFIERLWQVIPESNCAQDEILIRARIYPQALTELAAPRHWAWVTSTMMVYEPDLVPMTGVS